ncbi:unnamed protein product [Camellia sinensis]
MDEYKEYKETRAKLLLRGGYFDSSEELYRTCVSTNTRTLMLGHSHAQALASQETLAKLVKLPSRSNQGRCVICGGVGISDAYYCKECTQQEKDRDGCPKIVNLGSAKTDLFYERKKYGFKKRFLYNISWVAIVVGNPVERVLLTVDD